MDKGDVFAKNDFDPEGEIAALLPGLDGGGLPLEFSIDKAGGTLNISCGAASLKNLGGALTVNGERIEMADFSYCGIAEKELDFGRCHRAKYISQKYGLSWMWTVFSRKSDVLVMASLKNTGGGNLVLRDWDLLCCGGQEGGGPFGGRFAFLKWNPWDMGVYEVGPGMRGDSSNILHLYDPGANMTLLFGFLTMSRMKTRHIFETSDGGGIKSYCARLVFGEYELAPGQVFNSELCGVGFYGDPYEALESWAKKVQGIYRPKIKALPPVGWIGTWSNPTAASGGEPWEYWAIKNARAINERLAGFGVEYIWTSQLNLMDYIPGNWLHENKEEIPGGLEHFFRMQAELGFKPGLWVSPFWFYGEAKGMLEEHSGHLLRWPGGEPVCFEETWGWRYEDDDLPWYHMHRYNLDGTHPGTLEFVEKLFSYYKKIGVRYYMLDFLDVIENSVLHDKTKTAYQAGYAILGKIREVAGPDTHIQTAVASSPGFAGVIDAARIGRDFGESRPLDTFLADWRNATLVLHDQNYANTKYFLQNIMANYFTHGVLYQNDYNVFTVDRPYPTEHARLVATTFGLGGGSPMMLGDNICEMGEDRLRYIKLCLPRTAHSAKPADLFERVGNDHSRILKLAVDTKWESYMLAGVYNTDEGPCGLTLDFGRLGLDPEKKYVVYDFWNEEYCGVFKGGYPCTLPPESCKLYRIAEKRPYPWLLSTDMHIQQGFCEVKDVAWDPDNLRLILSVTRPVGERGNVYILLPRDYKLKNAERHRGVHLLKELLDFSVIMQQPVAFDSETKDFAFEFEKWDFQTLSPRGHIPYSTEQEWLDYMRENYKKQDTRVFE